MKPDTLKEYVRNVLVEKRIREADITGGKKTSWGSREHVRDLEVRIADLVAWRDKQPRGTEMRANYSRLVSRLRNELSSAQRAASSRHAPPAPKQKKKMSDLEDARLNLADAEVRGRYDSEERETIDHWAEIVAKLEKKGLTKQV